MELEELFVVRGGGDLGSGVALRLHNAGARVIILEIEQPLVVRRSVAFAQAVFSGETKVEGVRAMLARSIAEAVELANAGIIAVVVDPAASLVQSMGCDVLVDARLMKRPPELAHPAAPLVIGLGPGFIAGENCHAVVETQRGHFLGRVYWEGTAAADTGVPESVQQKTSERVLRAPIEGILRSKLTIGDPVAAGTVIAEVNGLPVTAPFDGQLRGLVADGLLVKKGMKIGDVDPRMDARFVEMVSDKALAVGGGVLEAVMHWKSGKSWD